MMRNNAVIRRVGDILTRVGAAITVKSADIAKGATTCMIRM